jgi:hypothetical protein
MPFQEEAVGYSAQMIFRVMPLTTTKFALFMTRRVCRRAEM